MRGSNNQTAKIERDHHCDGLFYFQIRDFFFKEAAIYAFVFWFVG
jgi:hypothetical protein